MSPCRWAPRRDSGRSRPGGAAHLFHRISFRERRMFCRICEFGCDGAALEVPRRPGAGEAEGTAATTGFLVAAPRALEPGSFREAAMAALGPSPACLVAGALPEGAAEGHGRLGTGPAQPGGSFLAAGFTAPAKGGDFFGRSLRGDGCLLPAAGPGAAPFFGPVAAALPSAGRSSFTAAKDRLRQRGRGTGGAAGGVEGGLARLPGAGVPRGAPRGFPEGRAHTVSQGEAPRRAVTLPPPPCWPADR